MSHLVCYPHHKAWESVKIYPLKTHTHSQLPKNRGRLFKSRFKHPWKSTKRGSDLHLSLVAKGKIQTQLTMAPWNFSVLFHHTSQPQQVNNQARHESIFMWSSRCPIMDFGCLTPYPPGEGFFLKMIELGGLCR